MKHRLQKLLADAGHGSRREIEDWIRNGLVTIDGRTAQLGDKADANSCVDVRGQRIRLGGSRSARVLLYHKPVGELTTRKDSKADARYLLRYHVSR